MVEDSVQIAREVEEDERDQVAIRFYSVSKHRYKTIQSCEGDIVIICNVLADYAELLGEYLSEYPERLDHCAAFQYEHYIERCNKIRSFLEKQTGYDRDAAVAKCRKRNQRRQTDDVGEDAMVLAVRKRMESKKQLERSAESKSN